MPPKKRRRLATAGTARGPRKKSRARPDISAQEILQALAIYDGQTCVGHLMPRGKSGVEAFNADTRSLGTYPNMKAAADAVCEAMA
jgi:hypothetical protein